MSYFDEGIVETNAEMFQTSKLLELDHRFAGVIKRISSVTSILLDHFVNCNEWEWHAVEGSITIQQIKNNLRVIKVFVDDNGKIFRKVPGFAEDHAIVVGIELTTEDPFTRKQIRNYLGSTFGNHYIDPKTFYKIALLPQTDHLYDIVVLDKGRCPIDIYAQSASKVYESIQEQLSKF
jgi:hypothetical protein